VRLTRRVLRLEQTAATPPPDRPCQGCGCGPGREPVAFCVVEAGEPVGPELCLSCGRRLALVIEFDKAG
jgi:hypothetical protein